MITLPCGHLCNTLEHVAGFNSPEREEWLRVGKVADDSTSMSFSRLLDCISAMADILLAWKRNAKDVKGK